MKKFSRLHLFLLSGILAFNACTKNASEQPQPAPPSEQIQNQNSKFYNVDLKLNDFEVSYASGKKVAVKEVPAKDYLSNLFYFAYDSLGNRVRMVTQYNDYRFGFGTISDSLKAGKYTILLIGTRTGSSGSDSGMLVDGYSLNQAKLDNYYISEILYKKINLTVSDHDTALGNVKLARMTGELVIDINDSILPANYHHFGISGRSVPGSYNIVAETLNPRPDGWLTVSPAYGGKEDSVIVSSAFSFFGSNNPCSFTISAFDKNGITLAEKNVDNVFIYTNKRTILRGKLFSTTDNLNSSVTIDPDYTETIIQTF